MESNIDKLQPQLEQLSSLSVDVLDYLSSSEVTSISIQGDLTTLNERRNK